MPHLAVSPFQRLGDVHHFADERIAVVGLAELGALLQCIVDGDAQSFRHPVGQLIDALQGNVENAADILQRRFRRHCAERRDLSNALLAVLLLDVGDDLFAAVLAEVDIDVGRFRAIRIEKSLEQQIVLQRIDVTEFQDVADQGAARRAAAPAGMPFSRAKRTKSHTMRK